MLGVCKTSENKCAVSESSGLRFLPWKTKLFFLDDAEKRWDKN